MLYVLTIIYKRFVHIRLYDVKNIGFRKGMFYLVPEAPIKLGFSVRACIRMVCPIKVPDAWGGV